MIRYTLKQRRGKQSPELRVQYKAVNTKDLAGIMNKRTGIPTPDVVVLLEELANDFIPLLMDGAHIKLGSIGSFRIELFEDKKNGFVDSRIKFYPSANLQKGHTDLRFEKVKK